MSFDLLINVITPRDFTLCQIFNQSTESFRNFLTSSFSSMSSRDSSLLPFLTNGLLIFFRKLFTIFTLTPHLMGVCTTTLLCFLILLHCFFSIFHQKIIHFKYIHIFVFLIFQTTFNELTNIVFFKSKVDTVITAHVKNHVITVSTTNNMIKDQVTNFVRP